MEPRWTAWETSNVLKVSERTLANWRWRGCGPPYEKLGGSVRYDPQAVREWVAAQTKHSTSEGQ